MLLHTILNQHMPLYESVSFHEQHLLPVRSMRVFHDVNEPTIDAHASQSGIQYLHHSLGLVLFLHHSLELVLFGEISEFS